jgi:hypothetical protein
VIHGLQIPVDFAGPEGWTYLMARDAGDNHATAMRRTLTAMNPGLGYGTPTTRPLPFGHAVYGLVDAAPFCVSDTLSHDETSHIRSQRQRPPASSRPHTNAGHHNGGYDKPRIRPATSNGGRHHDRPAEEGGRQHGSRGTKHDAKPHMGGWMGSTATSAPNRGGALRA